MTSDSGDLTRSILEEVGDLDVWEGPLPMPRGQLLRQVSSVVGLYCMGWDRVDQQLLNAAPQLKAVSTMSVGVDHIDLDACYRRGIPVGHTPDVLTETTADTAFALLLMASRRLVEGIDHVREGRWKRAEMNLLLGEDVHHTNLGVIGFGRIGAAVARRGRLGFGMNVLYYSRTRKPEPERDLDARYQELPELLENSDHVVVTAPLTPETRHLINATALERMKATATLVNVARGELVDTDALTSALQLGEIGAAGLDVTDPEPLPPGHVLLGLPNCVVIPHLGSASRRTREDMATMAARNLVAGLMGEPLPGHANPGPTGGPSSS